MHALQGVRTTDADVLNFALCLSCENGFVFPTSFGEMRKIADKMVSDFICCNGGLFMYREIAVKTLTGKGKLEHSLERTIRLENNISKTLGCWIINLQYDTEIKNKEIYIKGSFDIQLWYALDNDQKSDVYTEKINFFEKVNMSYRDLKTIDDTLYPKVYVNKYPSCVSMQLNDQNVELRIEFLMFVETFQEALLVVSCADDYQEDIPLEEEIAMNVNENYLIDRK